VDGNRSETGRLDRRSFLGSLPLLGAGAAVPPLIQGSGDLISRREAEAAERLSGLEFSDSEIDQLVTDLNRNLRRYWSLRAVDLDREVGPALKFDPRPESFQTPRGPDSFVLRDPGGLEKPTTDEDLAFLPLPALAHLIETRWISPVELTRLYLSRLHTYDRVLQCVITFTDDLALRQARRAEDEIMAGNYRGVLHGIPWGAKDLLAARGYPTTWGARLYQDQVIDYDAAVTERLEAAGAVLVAKLAMGELGLGDHWFGGQTRNPWDPSVGSSGSSAGPAAASAAGLVGFAIGTDTMGSIVGPAARNGTVGLRPTFGRVSRYGSMTVAWSMDRIGPLCRGVEGTAMVLQALHGRDPRDPTSRSVPFVWEESRPLSEHRIGYIQREYENSGFDSNWKDVYGQVLRTLEGLGARLEPVALPAAPMDAMRLIMQVEAATFFDELLLKNREGELDRQTSASWPNIFRSARFVPAVEYLRAQRTRRVLIEAYHRTLGGFDAIIVPDSSPLLAMTSLTGHPTLSIPCGFNSKGQPLGLVLVGSLYGEAALLDVGWHYAEATDWWRMRPRYVLEGATAGPDDDGRPLTRTR
jgi:Asp-tRNA(Asn)/Glu-tRNA(Gln) amidotransferase A subunit family amidase